MFYVNHRWLGGTLTNWATLQKSIKRLKTLKAMIEDGRMAQLSKKEAARLEREMKHLNQNLAGVENMTMPPDAMFVVDSHTEEIAVREARRMGVPVVAVVDTNSDPDQVDWVIPGNDDALARHSPVHLQDRRRRDRRPRRFRTDAARRSEGRGRRGDAAKASNTWTPAPTNPTRSRKAISSMCRRAPTAADAAQTGAGGQRTEVLNAADAVCSPVRARSACT